MYLDLQTLIATALAPFILVPIGAAVATIIVLIVIDAVDAVLRPPPSG
jgi:hypothetical protein